MRGRVFRYEKKSGQGYISGDDSKLYSFSRDGVIEFVEPLTGRLVDFQSDGDRATRIFLLAEVAASESLTGNVPGYSGEDLSVWGYFVKCIERRWNLNGRARRKEYWSFTLLFYIFNLAVVIILRYATPPSNDISLGTPIYWIFLLAICFVYLFVFLPAIVTLGVRRLHDVGLSGWLIFFLLVPVLGVLFFLVVSILDSQRQLNDHGPIPKPADKVSQGWVDR